MKIVLFFIPLLFSVSICACSESTSGTEGIKLANPAALTLELQGNDSAVLSWTDNAKGEEGYYVFCKEDNAGYYVEPAATLAPESTSYTFKGLAAGWYSFGVQAKAADAKYHSDIVWSERARIIDWSQAPAVNVSKLNYNYAFLSVSYGFERAGSPSDYGICLSTDHTPTVEDTRFQGPALNGQTVEHIVSTAVLDYGKEYHLRAYVFANGEYWYGKEHLFTISADDGKPSLSWNKLSFDGLPSSIEVFETTTPLNGRKFHAWYAVADCTGDVQFKVLNPSAKATLEKQAEAEGGCYVLINGGIYGTKHIGVIYANGQKQAWRDEVDGSYWAYDSKLYNITRAIIGTDASGKPSAYWTSAPDADHVYFYDRPLTTVMGGSLWGPATDGNPGPAISWQPRNAISTGPMLLYDGKSLVIPTKNDAGYYISNYECWAEDIFPTKPDRTAVGYTAEGKIVLFICDGRIADSDGAYLRELAQIMKEIGCVAAMNLDGGGSTAMIVNGKRLNSLLTGSGTATENRPVLSTLGFFAK